MSRVRRTSRSIDGASPCTRDQLHPAGIESVREVEYTATCAIGAD